ncbi:MAG TPA: serine hydrolase domain-containing protein [Methylomirabilota bacterium]|nr:serine hydrolase domain-containing protein [Methylomirabilota bacterium]
MKRPLGVVALLLSLLLISVATAPGLAPAQGLPIAKPEEVGLSSQRLARATEIVKGEIAKGRYPGVVALVARRGKVVYFEALGQRDPQSGTPMTKDAIFRLYSMTKPFTSVAMMMLVEDGKVLLNDPVSRHLPALKGLQVSVAQVDAQSGKVSYALVPAEREMTIQDVLRHTSGLVYDTTSHSGVQAAYLKAGVTWKDVTPAEQIERLARVPLAHQPGSAWEYSISTDVTGRVIEAITGGTLGQFFQERIFAPLSMTDTGFLVPAAKVGRLAQPFAKDPVTGEPVALLDVTVRQKNDAGGAGTAGTVADYARFSQMLLNGGHLGGTRLLGRATVAQMTADHLGDIPSASPILARGYGFGLGVAVRKETGLHWVTGSAGEYRWAGAAGTSFWVDPKEQMVVVWMTQGLPGQRRAEDRDLFRQLVQAALVD